MARVDVPDRLPESADLDAAEPLAEDVDGPARRVLLRAAHAQDRALARAVASDQRPVLA